MIDADGNYIDPGQATCQALSNLDRGSVFYASRAGYAPGNTGDPGYYCGSYRDVGYGTLENGRKAVNVYGSATYRINDSISLFLDMQAGYSHQVSYNTPLQWENSVQIERRLIARSLLSTWPPARSNSGSAGTSPSRRTAASMPARSTTSINTLSLNTGIKGTIADSSWNYEALFGHSQNKLESKEPALVSAKAQALYLGPLAGHRSGQPATEIYNAPHQPAVYAADRGAVPLHHPGSASTMTRAAQKTSH